MTEAENRLYSIHRQRNRYAYVPNMALIGASTYFHRSEILSTNYAWISLLLVGLGLAMRVITTEVIYEQWKNKVGWARGFNVLAFILLVTGWIVHFYAITSTYGAESHETTNTLIFVAGLIAGSTISLASHRPTYFIYTTGMCVGICAIYYFDPTMSHKSVTAYIVVFYFFNASNMLAAHKQLCRSIDNELKSERETIRIKGIIDTVPGFVAIVDKNKIVTLANRMTLTIFPGIVGKKLGTVDPKSKWEQDIINFMGTNKHSVIMEEKTTGPDGKDLFTLVTAQKTLEEGAIIVALVTNELMEAREKLRQQEAKAHFSAKLASLGEMAAGIAHEVNNPLTIIQGSANIIQKLVEAENIDRKTVVELTTKVSDTTERISKIIKSLKNLSRSGEKDRLAPVDLSIMIGQVLDICGQKAKNHSIDLRLPKFEAPVVFPGREVQLGQVLLNLISNAIDAVKDLPERWVEVTYLQYENKLEICVTDSGTGIPTEIADKIMEPFFTTKEINQGTGLGLSISQSIMREHNGELILDQSAKNTTFKMILPFTRV